LWLITKGLILTSLYEIETPGNFAESTTVKPVGFGGKDAAEAPYARRQAAKVAGNANNITA
jgi:hypothetical protein